MKQQHRLVTIRKFRNVALDALTHLGLLDDLERRWLSRVGDGQFFDWRIDLSASSPSSLP